MVALSDVLNGNVVSRLDSTYFLQDDLKALAKLREHAHAAVGSVAYVTDGIHASIPFCDGSGIKVLSAKHPKDGYFDDANFEEIEPESHRLNPRTALREGDVLLSTVGTIGNAAVVEAALLPANSDRHVAILRPLSVVNYPVSSEFLTAALLSPLGRMQTRREITGNVQPNLFLDKVRTLLVPRFDSSVEAGITRLYRSAQVARSNAKAALAEAEGLLLDALGLHGWSPPEPLTYTRSATAVAQAGRLDAEFAAPRVQALLALLSSSGQTLADVARVRREKFKPATEGVFDYIEIGDLDGFGRCSSTSLDMIDAPSRATWHVRPGDVLTSTVRPIRRLSAIVADAQNGDVCSSGFVVLKPTAISPECLLTFLRLPLVCELMHLFATASMYPALAEKDLMALPTPTIDSETDAAVAVAVANARNELARSETLLEAAKRAVEIAIQDNESAALAFIAAQETG